MRGFSDFSGFCCLNDRILLHAFGKDEGAAALRYAREAGDADKDRILVLCDGEAEEIIEKAQGYVPDTVNIYRAAAFSLVWKNAPAAFSRSLLTDPSVGKKVTIAFYGSDAYTLEIFKALVSTYIEIRRTPCGVKAEKIKYVFFADKGEREKLKGLPYFSAGKALEEAKGKAGYYELPSQLAEISVKESDDGDCFKDAFVWAVVAGGRERAEKVAAELKEKGLEHAVFYAGKKDCGRDGLYEFDASDDCAGFYLKMLLIAFSRDTLYDSLKGGDPNALLAEKRKKWKEGAKLKVKRDSNLYAALALRGLLLSLGFDCKEGAKSDLSAFNAVYDEGNPRTIDNDGTVYYDNAVCAKDSLRTHIAFREHLRWNEYMFACGVGPASKEEHAARDKNGLLAEGKHVNVTTWKGLEDYRKVEAKRKGTDEESTDVQRYDFQLADGAADMLASAGYAITEIRGRKI